jgi:hypothetical protein
MQVLVREASARVGVTRACMSCLTFSDPRPSSPSSPGNMRSSTAPCSACPEVGCRGGSDRSSSQTSSSSTSFTCSACRFASHADMRCLDGTRPGNAPRSISIASPTLLPVHSAAVSGMRAPSCRSAWPPPSPETCVSVTRSRVGRPSASRSSTTPRGAPSPARWRARASSLRPGSWVTVGVCVQPRLACAASACQPASHHGSSTPPPSLATHVAHETIVMCLG